MIDLTNYYKPRCQIRLAADPEEKSSLRVHAARVDGLPLCGTPEAPWEGKPMRAVPVLGLGPVTCGK